MNLNARDIKFGLVAKKSESLLALVSHQVSLNLSLPLVSCLPVSLLLVSLRVTQLSFRAALAIMEQWSPRRLDPSQPGESGNAAPGGVEA